MLCARPMPDSSMPPHHTGMPCGLRDIVDALGFGEAAHAAELDVDDAAGVHRDGLLGVMRRADAFVETDRRFELGLQLGVIDDLVVRQRLLDHHQIEFVQAFQTRPRRPACRPSWRRPSAGCRGSVRAPRGPRRRPSRA